MNLLFKRIELNNFGSFSGSHSFQLQRQSGLYFITGDNRAEPSLTSNGTGKSTLFNALFWALTGKTLRIQRPGASIESWYSPSTVKVTLDLQVNGTDYQITRTRKPNSLTLNGQLIDQQVINDLIKLNEETLKRTLLVGQFVPLFLDLKAEQQSSLFSEALNLDLWLTAADNASKQFKVYEAKATKLEVSKATLSGGLAQLKEQYTLETSREKTFNTDKKRRLVELREQLAAAIEIRNAAESCFNAATAMESDAAVSSTGDASSHAARALERENTQIEAALAAELRVNLREAEVTKANLSRYQAANEVCPECNQPVNQDHIQQKVTELTLHYKTLLKQVKQIEQDHLKTTKMLEQSRLDLTKAEADARAKQIAYIEQQRQFSDLKRQFDSASYKVKELEKELDKAKHATNPYTESCERLAETYFNTEEKIKDLDSQLKEVNETSSIYKYWTTAYKEIRLNLIDETLQELEIAANRHIQSLGLDDWQIEFKTERENKSGTISHSFTTVIYPNGQTKPIPFESYSGGESQRLQLAVTAALSEILLSRAGISTNIEILDEPSRNLSQQGIIDLLECLKERAAELNRCIYFIDHNSLESGYFDQVITIQKDQSGSRIT